MRICELNPSDSDGWMSSMKRLPRLVIVALVILLGAIFIAVGMSKLAGPSATRWTEKFVRWGYPAVAARLVGMSEILGGLGLFIPRSRRLAAALIVGLMIGALFTHLVHGEFPRLIPPLVLGGLACVVYTSRRGS